MIAAYARAYNLRVVNRALEVTDARVKRVLWAILLLNWLVAGAKWTVGWKIGSVSLLADGVHSVLDGTSNIVGIVGLSLAARPPDQGHPYGHRRFESVAALAIGGLIAVAFVEIVKQLGMGLTGQTEPPEVTLPAVVVVIATILINLAISRYEAREGRRLNSTLLTADAAHTASDAAAAMTVLLSLGAVALGIRWADLVGAAIVAVFIGGTAWRVLSYNLQILADAAQLDPRAVREVALHVEGVRGAHRIRSRGGSQDVHVDLHIHLDPSMNLHDAHEKTHQVMDALRRRFPQIADIVIHTEPADGRERDEENLPPR